LTRNAKEANATEERDLARVTRPKPPMSTAPRVVRRLVLAALALLIGWGLFLFGVGVDQFVSSRGAARDRRCLCTIPVMVAGLIWLAVRLLPRRAR
jgi:hypothetical protein